MSTENYSRSEHINTEAAIKSMSDTMAVILAKYKDNEASINIIRSEAQKDRDDFRRALEEQSNRQASALQESTEKIYKAISAKDRDIRAKLDQDSREIRENQKTPWRIVIALLSLIFSVIAAVGAVLGSSLNRIENDAKVRSAANATRLKEEMRIRDKERSQDLMNIYGKYDSAIHDLSEKHDKELKFVKDSGDADHKRSTENIIKLYDKLHEVEVKSASEDAKQDEFQRMLMILINERKTFIEGRIHSNYEYARDIDTGGSRRWVNPKPPADKK